MTACFPIPDTNGHLYHHTLTFKPSDNRRSVHTFLPLRSPATEYPKFIVQSDGVVNVVRSERFDSTARQARLLFEQ